MIITNFETGEEGAFLTWIAVYDMLVYEILELPQDTEDLKWEVEEVMLKHGLERDSIDGVRYVLACIGSNFLGIDFEETDKVFEQLMDAVEHETGRRTIEDLDKCLEFDFLRSIVRWRIVDCKRIHHSTASLSSS